MAPTIPRTSICLLLAMSLGSAACTVETGPPVPIAASESSAPTEELEPRSSSLGIARPNTIEDAWMGSEPLDVETFFDPSAFEPENESLAYAPQEIFTRKFATFGDRMWERTSPTRFELVGSAGSIAFEYTTDFRKVQFKNGKNRTPLHFEGTLMERRVKAGFISVLGMSGYAPSDEVEVVAHASAPHVVGGIVLVLGAVTVYCALLIQNCALSAAMACNPLSAQVTNPCTISGGPTGYTINFGCTWTCVGGGGGSGGGSATGPASGSASESASESVSASASDSNGEVGGDDGEAGEDDGGGDDGDDGGEGDDCGGESTGNSFQIGSIPGAGGTMMDYAAADTDEGGDEGGDGGGGGGGGGSSTGC